MKTDDLIRALAQDTIASARPGAVLIRTLPAAVAASALLLWASLGFRADPAPLMRLALMLMVAGVGLGLGWRLLRPEARVAPGSLLGPVLVPLALAVGLVVWALSETPPSGWLPAWQGQTRVACLISVPMLSVPPVAAVLASFRAGATRRPGLAGALAGLAGGGLGAAVYALHCTEDSPLFYVSWYGLGIALVTAASTLLGKRVLRW